MKRILLLIIVVISIISASAQTDTFYNNGDGKVVIIDKRPRTIINRTPIKKVETQPVIININDSDPFINDGNESYYDYWKRHQPVINNYPIERYNDGYYHSDNQFFTILFLVFAIPCALAVWFIFHEKRSCKNEKCEHQCDDKPPSVVNHFHVAGGNVDIDASKASACPPVYSDSFNPYTPKKEEESHHSM